MVKSYIENYEEILSRERIKSNKKNRKKKYRKSKDTPQYS